jgi:hypothetical protein
VKMATEYPIPMQLPYKSSAGRSSLPFDGRGEDNVLLASQ